MSTEEKNIWIYAIVTLVVPSVYLVSIATQLHSTAVGEIAYQVPMLAALVASIVASTIVQIIASIIWRKEKGKRDQRDRDINRRGDAIGFYAVSVGTFFPLALAMVGFEQFWIANAIYVMVALATLISSAAKLVAYRRGF
jgi:amino acid transporter